MNLANTKYSRLFATVALGSFLFAGLFGVFRASAATDLSDSLSRSLRTADDVGSRMALLIDLTDLQAETPEGEAPYCQQLFAAARRADDHLAVTAALPAIVIRTLADPAQEPGRFLDEAQTMLRGSAYDGVADYYRIMIQAHELLSAPRNQKAAACERLVAGMRMWSADETPYQRAGRLFLQGVVAFQLLESTAIDAVEAGLPYWEEAWQLTQGFHVTARRLFKGSLVSFMTLAYSSAGDAAKLMKVSDDYLALLDSAFSDPELLRRRPYIPREASYLSCYRGLINCSHLIGQERAHGYYLRYRKFVWADDGAEELLRDNTTYYTISHNHYAGRGEYDMALVYCDSLIRVQESGDGVWGVSSVPAYTARAQILRALGRYEEACATYERVIGLSDSLSRREYKNKVGEMEAKLGVEKLRVTMQTHRRWNLMLFLIFIGVVVMGAGAYFYRSLRRERRLREELRRQCEAAQESGRMKSAFLNMMGHEIRTPLNVIGGFAEVLASGSVPASQQGEYLSLMHRHSRLLTSLMNDMLEVSNLDNHSDNLPCEPVDVRNVLREAVGYAETIREDSTIVLGLDLPEEAAVVCTNPGYLTHVFHELVRNALKFTIRGSVTLSCRVDREAGSLISTVTDTGIGIPEDKSEFIFGRFTKVDSFTQGVGLGLYLCRLIMEKLGGTIAADTSYAGGMRVVVTLPLSNLPEEA